MSASDSQLDICNLQAGILAVDSAPMECGITTPKKSEHPTQKHKITHQNNQT